MAAYTSFSKWIIEVNDDVERGCFLFSEAEQTVRLQCSRGQIDCIIAGVEDIKLGNGDYCIGDKCDNVLWFWWHPKEI